MPASRSATISASPGQAVILRRQWSSASNVMDSEMSASQGEMNGLPRGMRALDAARKKQLIAAVANCVVAHTDELTALDSAIGDGDHGQNMKRGFEAVLQDLQALGAMQLPDLLKAIGTKLVMTVGGASGPLYGTLFLALG